MSSEAASLGIVAYIALFVAVAFAFLFVNLLLGRFLRPSDPQREKGKIYECGEPAIGSSFVQFDLRFYVVALLFIIFDVEIAFFFPWAMVFGKSLNMADPRLEVVQAAETTEGPELTHNAQLLYKEMGILHPEVPTRVPATLGNQITADPNTVDGATTIIKRSSRQLAWLTIADICVFFAVLLVGFAYVWKRGDLDWVRATAHRHASGIHPSQTAVTS